MKNLLSQLGIQASEGRHIFEYESIQLDWWEESHPVNYEIELIFGEDANIFLFYFVPDTEGIVERSLILVAETAVQSEELIHGLLAEEVKNAVFPNLQAALDAEQGGVIIQSLAVIEQIVMHFINQLTNTTYIAQSELADADTEPGEATDSYTDYEAGAILSHFLAMYFMNNQEVTADIILGYLDFALEMEGPGYIAAIQQDAHLLQTDSAHPLQPYLFQEHEPLTADLLQVFLTTITQFQVQDS
ncbi:MAG: hypothetical protein ACPGJS_08255 [Flammeovirgaceae bacterium]